MRNIKLTKLKELYYQAIADNQESFLYEKTKVLTSYAKYLIEFLESKSNE